MGFVCDLHSTPLLARRGFPLAFRVGARWVSTPSSMPRLGAQFPLFVEFCVASPPSPRRASAATSHSSRTGGRRCVLCSIRIACFALSLSLLQHVAAILGSRSSRCSRSSYRFSLTACYHLRLRPNSILITQKPNIPEVFRPPSLFPVDPPQGGATAISHGAHPQTQPLSNSATVLLESQWACAHHDPTARCSAAGGLLVKSYLAQLQAAKW